ncbi:MAG TPA: recombinase family protein [Acetobacteraceae bacterium]|nr:recombinase family protein [Acetobacteraceae bacterium]
MARLAFSYLRFSTLEQASGDSHRRQLETAEEYAVQHHLSLDRQLSFRDLGVSAFRGRNAREGALRAFLEAVEHNLVPPESVLLIESLDRLSRDRILSAQALFLQIVQAGVTIVTLVDGRSYSRDSLNTNPLDLIVSLVSMMRANEESEMKSRRIRAAFDTKRAALATRPWSARCPGWLRLDRSTGRFTVIEERAEVVRRIYREVLAGTGHQTLCRQLNEERVPLFGQGNQRGRIWQKTLVRHLLRTPTVVGTFTPFVSEHENGVTRVRPLPPIPGYYPAIVNQVDWNLVQARRAAWSRHYHNDVPKTGRANLLAGLSRCPFCGRAMVLLGGGNPNWRYYMCRRAFNGAGCSDRWIRYPGIEDALTTDIEKVIQGCPKPVLGGEMRADRLRHVRSRLYQLRERRDSIDLECPSLRQSSRPAIAAKQAVGMEISKLLEERRRLRLNKPWLDITLAKKLSRLREVAAAREPDRKELHEILRSLFLKVVVDWERGRLVFHWKHGGESSVRAATKPQREVANRRRADRPRFGPGERIAPLPVVAR